MNKKAQMLHAAQKKIAVFESKYRMKFADFEKAWLAGKTAAPYSYNFEQDFLEREAAITDRDALQGITEWQS
jgi:hypothetical protein